MALITIAAPIKEDHPIDPSVTLAAGASQALITINGKGYAAIDYQGDGDGQLTVQAIVDGAAAPEDSLLTNEEAHGDYAFNKSLLIQLDNPGAASVTGTSMTINARGLKN